MSKQTEALKLALEALIAAFQGKDKTGQVPDAITAICEALAEQPAQQEPYGWKVYGVNSLFMGEFAEADAKAEAKRIGGTCITFPLYTSPPASKPWVGLTSEEVKHQWEIWRANTPRYVGFAKGIESKLKEKNT